MEVTTVTTAIIIHAPTPVETTTITMEGAGVDAAAEVMMAVGEAAVDAAAIITMAEMMMTALIVMAKRISFQIIWNIYPLRTIPCQPGPCLPEILNLISLTRKSNAFWPLWQFARH